MPYTIILEIQVNVSVTLKDPLGPFMCMADQLVTIFAGIATSAFTRKSASVRKHRCLRF